jgi:hypothetical protein
VTAKPSLSVVVALISGDEQDLRGCLTALAAQTRTIGEIIVPYDDPCAGVTRLQAEFPAVHFIRAVGLDTTQARQGGSREHHDLLRTVGLRRAAGDIVLLTEDHAHAAPTWAAEMADALERHPGAAAVGGAVECDSASDVNRAVWFCDFGRYQGPLPEGPAPFVSDSNVAYRATALASVSDVWREAYREPVVHGAMQAAGLTLCTAPRALVWQARRPLGMVEALRERVVWGRSFASARSRHAGSGRWALAVLSPLLPLVLTWRLAVVTFRRGSRRAQFVRCAPLILLLNLAWSLGELTGYVTGAAD